MQADAGTRWLRRLAGYCWRYRPAVLVGFAASIAGAGVAASTPLAVRQVIDEVVIAQRQPIGPWLVLLFCASVLRYGLSFVRRYCAGRIGNGVNYALRTDLFDSLQRLDGPQQDRLRTGQVVSRAIADVGAVDYTLQSVPLLASNVVLFIASLVVMAALSPPLTLVTLVTIPALFFSARRASARLSPTYRAYSHQAGVLAGVIEAAVSGVRVVKGFGQEAREMARFENEATTLFRSGVHRARRSSDYYPVLNAVPVLGQVGILSFGGWLALVDQITLGTFLAFATYLTLTVAPVRWLVSQLPSTQEAKSGMLRLMDILDASPSITDRAGARLAPDGPASIEFSAVTFGYSSGTNALTDLSLRVDPGQTLALVGGTGSGKSTVALLLARFYDPQEGSVRLAGHDLRDLSLASLRARMGVVYEESFLFSDTVRANIAFGRPDATEADVVAAARGAEADAFIRALPEGYDTVIGERGLTLSGGQRQRIALARALLTDPPVLVLDDATTAVDAGVEAEIHATLRRVMAGRTTLLIAHRRSTLQLADQIAVLHHGRVVDIGRHEDLATRCSRYRQLLSGHDDEIGGEVTDSVHGTSTDSSGVTAALWDKPPAADEGNVFGTAEAYAEPDRPAPPVVDHALDLAVARRSDPTFRPRQLVRPVWGGLAVVAGLMVLDSFAQLTIPWLTRTAIDDGVSKNAPQVLWAAAGIALAVVVASWAIRVAQERTVGQVGERVRLWLGVKAYAHLQRLGLDFYEQERGGQIMTRMTADVGAITIFVQRSLPLFLVSVVSFVGVLAVMVTIDSGLALAVAVLLPIFVGIVFGYRNVSAKAYESVREALSEVNASFQESVAGIRTAQAYGRQERNIAAFAGLAENYRKSNMRAARYLATFGPSVEWIGDLAIVIVLAVGAGRVVDGTLTEGGIIAFLLYVTMLFGPVQQMSSVLDAYQRAKVGAGRIRELLGTPTSVPQAGAPKAIDRVTGKVEFNRVRFTYPRAETEALAGISLRIEPGETVAVVGETGAGKSTMLKLIARFYDPGSGTIEIDGTELRNLDLHAYRQRLGIVPQETYLFEGSVANTIAYGRPEATPAEIELAARAVGAHDMIATLPHGYLHPIGEQGHRLSAGQRQLLALARAQLVDPDVLLLDEATAALDLATEAVVIQATSNLTQPRTTLIIAHRLTTAQRADRIVVLDHGRIAEIGAHSELLSAGGRYAQLWNAYIGGSSLTALTRELQGRDEKGE